MTLYVVAFRQGQQAFQSALGAIGGMYEHNLYMSNLWEYLRMADAATPTAATAEPTSTLARLAPKDGANGAPAPGRGAGSSSTTSASGTRARTTGRCAT